MTMFKRNQGFRGAVERFTFKIFPKTFGVILPIFIFTGLMLLGVVLLTAPEDFEKTREISRMLGW